MKREREREKPKRNRLRAQAVLGVERNHFCLKARRCAVYERYVVFVVVYVATVRRFERMRHLEHFVDDLSIFESWRTTS